MIASLLFGLIATAPVPQLRKDLFASTVDPTGTNQQSIDTGPLSDFIASPIPTTTHTPPSVLKPIIAKTPLDLLNNPIEPPKPTKLEIFRTRAGFQYGSALAGEFSGLGGAGAVIGGAAVVAANAGLTHVISKHSSKQK
jgi:hypothetical protein